MSERCRSASLDEAEDEIAKFEGLVGVDKYALDENLEQQGDLFYRVSRAYELAQRPRRPRPRSTACTPSSTEASAKTSPRPATR